MTSQTVLTNSLSIDTGLGIKTVDLSTQASPIAATAMTPLSIQPSAHVAAAAPALQAPAPGATLHVGSGETYSTIQAAVAAAHDGDTIVVDSGVYHEQVTENGLSNVTIQAAQGASVIIEAPATMTENGSGVTAVVAVENGTNDVLRNITVNGNGAGDGVAGMFAGVYYQDASGGTDGVNVFGVRDGGPSGTITGAQQTGYGVLVDNDAGGDRLGFTMTGGSISDFQKGGLYIIHANADISGVSITGAGSTDVTAQNGAIFSDATGSFHDSSISQLGFTLDSATASGVLVLDASDFTVTGNVISGSFANPDELRNFVGVYEINSSSDATGAITDNTISNVNEGVVGDGGFGGFVVSGNDISNITEYEPGQPGFGIDFQPDPSVTADLLIEGSAGNDTILGALGDDTLSGGSGGIDTLAGGLGDDTYHVDSSTVSVIENAGEGTDSVIASVSYTLTANVENLTLTGSGDLTGAGNVLDNHIVGNLGDNVLQGGKGDDFLTGGAGSDSLYGGAGNDTLLSRGDGDLLNGGAGDDTFRFNDLQDTVAARINGFQAGETIDLRLAGAFTEVSSFDGAAGEFTVTYNAAHDRTTIAFDVDGDGHADHRIVLNGGDFSHSGDIHFVL